MRRALRLAARGRHASPNPMVGCVILDSDGNKVGEGYHVRPGAPHAETVALAQAGARAHGGTAYVTLEPCSHYGRTPPCADALISAGIRRIVAATLDPDSRVSGKGCEKLAAAGVEVEIGVCESAARDLNAAYFKHRTTGLPFVTLKTAMTLDGRTATSAGESRWITSAVTRKWVHRRLRDRCDAIMVGIGTVLADDPVLTTRLLHRPPRNPLRVVVDTRLRIPLSSRVVRDARESGGVLVACGENAADPKRKAELEDAGVVVLPLPVGPDGRVDLRALLVDLGGARGLQSVLVEGGALLAAGMLEAGLVDEYIACIAPKLIGPASPGLRGSEDGGPKTGSALPKAAGLLNGAIAIEGWKVRKSGPDIVIRGRLGLIGA